MNAVAESEVRDHLAELLERVQRGEQLAILRDGRHVATLVPVPPAKPEVDAVIARMRERREELRRGGVKVSVQEILDARNEGRKG